MARLENCIAEISDIIESIKKADGYYFNWGTSNVIDQAYENQYPSAIVVCDRESSTDDSGAIFGMCLAEITIQVNAENVTVEDVPQYAINSELEKAASDLKKRFLVTASGYLPLTDSTLSYKGFEKIRNNSGDIFKPAGIKLTFELLYHNTLNSD